MAELKLRFNIVQWQVTQYVSKTTYSPSFWYPDALMSQVDMPFHSRWPKDKAVLACTPAIFVSV